MKYKLAIFFFLLGIIEPLFSMTSPSDMPGSSGIGIAVFDVNATPPVGSRLAYDPMVNSGDLTLRAKGVVLLGDEEPIVLCVVDWLGIANESQDLFKEALADAAGTIPNRVVVHTVHQHDAPLCDFTAEKILKENHYCPKKFSHRFS